MKFADQVKIRLISQLINGVSRVTFQKLLFQKLLRYFSGIHISIFFVPLFPVIPVMFFISK